MPERMSKQAGSAKTESGRAPLDDVQCLTLACLLEVSAAKAGNVHRAADFVDMNLVDFLASAVAAAPELAKAGCVGVGPAVLRAVTATRRVTRVNTNLGTVLLLAPLSAAASIPRSKSGDECSTQEDPCASRAPGECLAERLRTVLRQLTPEDSQAVYAAIRMANPGGLGECESMDVLRDAAPDDLLVAMRHAAERDAVARQYVNDFADVFELVVPALRAGQDHGWPLGLSIVHAHLTVISWIPDTLITRKCGRSVAQAASDRAAWVLEAGDPNGETFQDRLAEFDFWLRCDGHRRNPGTSADLIAAGLYVALREQWLRLPLQWA